MRNIPVLPGGCVIPPPPRNRLTGESKEASIPKPLPSNKARLRKLPPSEVPATRQPQPTHCGFGDCLEPRPPRPPLPTNCGFGPRE
jgi:hypothetical protein